MPTYSVIVPVYNAEPYLKRCVESILDQSLRDLELILVDDGSTDASGTICDEYAAEDNRILVTHKKNGGVSSARNVGMEIASGNRILFVDADDYISHDCLQKINEISSDFIVFSFDSDKKNDAIIESDGIYHFNEDNELIAFFKDHFLQSIGGKVYMKSIINNNNLVFDTSLDYGEDTLFNNAYIQHIKTAASSSYVGYHRTTENEISLSRKFNKPLNERADYISKLFDLWKSNKSIQELWINTFLWNAEIEFNRIANSNKSTTEKVREIRRIINSPIFRQGYNLNPSYFPRVNRFMLKNHCYLFLLQKYK